MKSKRLVLAINSTVIIGLILVSFINHWNLFILNSDALVLRESLIAEPHHLQGICLLVRDRGTGPRPTFSYGSRRLELRHELLLVLRLRDE